MRHKVAGYKLGRNTSHRRSLLRNLVTSVIVEERVETTVPKAKAARPIVEKMITLGKRGDLAARRLAGGLPDDRRGRGEAVRHRRPALRRPQRRIYCASSAPAGIRATAPTRLSSNSWAAKRCWTKSARSAPKTAPRKSRKPRKPWKKPKRKPSTTAASSRSRKKPKTRKSKSRFCLEGHGDKPCLFCSRRNLSAFVIPPLGASPRRNLF